MTTPAITPFAPGLYAILDLHSVGEQPPLAVAEALLSGGATALQLRGKGRPPAELLPLATDLAARCQAAGVPFIMNDHPRLAAECEAHGVHLGQVDVAVAEARLILGPTRIIGLSTHTLEQALEAARRPNRARPDYLGFGPIFASPTKPGVHRAQGLETLTQVSAAVDLPVVAIGGLTLADAARVAHTGAWAAALISGILAKADVGAAVREFTAGFGQPTGDY